MPCPNPISDVMPSFATRNYDSVWVVAASTWGCVSHQAVVVPDSRPCYFELPFESWRVSLCGRLAWCHPRVMGWRLQRRFSLNLSSLCVTDLTAVAIHNASTTAAAVLSEMRVAVSPLHRAFLRDGYMRISRQA